jgi:hypothetical protein
MFWKKEKFNTFKQVEEKRLWLLSEVAFWIFQIPMVNKLCSVYQLEFTSYKNMGVLRDSLTRLERPADGFIR